MTYDDRGGMLSWESVFAVQRYCLSGTEIACQRLSGTEIAYGATRSSIEDMPPRSIRSLSSYACTTPCPVLT
eukprot:3297205-Rhodomonas_salina.2